MSFIRRVLFFAVLAYVPVVSAQQAADSPATGDSAQAEADGKDEARPTVRTTWQQRGEWVGEIREVLTFTASGQEAWLTVQRARGTSLGNALLVSASSVGGPSHIAGLHAELPGYGWHTFHLDVGERGDLAGLLQAAVSALPQAGKLLLVCEGQACLELARNADDLGATGLVCLNVPARNHSNHVLLTALDPLETIVIPSLVLQEDPFGWPRYQPIGEDVEMHLLPRGHTAKRNSRVLRKLRGWLKRRHSIG